MELRCVTGCQSNQGHQKYAYYLTNDVGDVGDLTTKHILWLFLRKYVHTAKLFLQNINFNISQPSITRNDDSARIKHRFLQYDMANLSMSIAEGTNGLSIFSEFGAKDCLFLVRNYPKLFAKFGKIYLTSCESSCFMCLEICCGLCNTHQQVCHVKQTTVFWHYNRFFKSMAN